jgi:hypothetical protein
LVEAISTWAEVNRIEGFFKEIESRLGGLSDPTERNALWERLRLGRKMLGTVDALEHFRRWRAPEERLGE